MRTIIVALTCAMLGTLSVQGQDDASVRVRIDIEKLIPSRWHVAAIDTEAKPYGWDQTAGPDSGLSIHLLGPTLEEDKRQKVHESLTIWIMPRTFRPVTLPEPGPAHMPARFLGANDRHTIYALPWADVPTWKTWEADIRRFFKTHEPNK